jgi:hypothetical protein
VHLDSEEEHEMRKKVALLVLLVAAFFVNAPAFAFDAASLPFLTDGEPIITEEGFLLYRLDEAALEDVGVKAAATLKPVEAMLIFPIEPTKGYIAAFEVGMSLNVMFCFMVTTQQPSDVVVVFSNKGPEKKVNVKMTLKGAKAGLYGLVLPDPKDSKKAYTYTHSKPGLYSISMKTTAGGKSTTGQSKYYLFPKSK